MPQLLKQFGSAFVTTQLAGLGVDPQMIQMFKLSQNQFNARTGNIVGSQTLQDWLKTSESVKTLGRDFTILSIKLGTKLVPVIDDIVRVMNELMGPFLKLLGFVTSVVGFSAKGYEDLSKLKSGDFSGLDIKTLTNGLSQSKRDMIEHFINLSKSLNENTKALKHPKKGTLDVHHHGISASRSNSETTVSQHDLQVLSNITNGI